MNDTVLQSEPIERLGVMRAFFRGFASGSISGALMMGVVAVMALGLTAAVALSSAGWLASAAAAIPHVTWVGGAFMAVATGLFSGLMNAKHALTESVSPLSGPARTTTVAIPVPSMEMAPAVAPMVTPSADKAEAPTKNWAESTGQGSSTQSRVQQILANGSLSDRDRAQAILAARETTDSAPRLH